MSSKQLAENRFRIRNIDWKTYKTISDALPNSHYHMSYDGNDLELMSVYFDHAHSSRLLGQFIFVMAEEDELPLLSLGGMTLIREDLARAIEANETFYLVNEPRVRFENIDLRIHPPPDLCVEIDLTTDSLRRMRIYGEIAIPEIWRFNGEAVFIYRLEEEGKYKEIDDSRYFPYLKSSDLTYFMQKRNEINDTEMIREFRKWIRNPI